MTEAGVDTANSENVILITQLREQIESLKKQVASRDQQLLEKEKKVGGLSQGTRILQCVGCMCLWVLLFFFLGGGGGGVIEDDETLFLSLTLSLSLSFII